MPVLVQSLVTTEDVTGAPGNAIPLAVTVSAQPGRSVASTYLLGLPKGALLADADHAVTAADEKSVIDVTDWDLPQLSVTLPPQKPGTYTLALVSVSRPENGEPMNFTRSTFVLDATAETGDLAIGPEPGRPDERPSPGAAGPRAAPTPATAAGTGGSQPKSPVQGTEVFIPEPPPALQRVQAMRPGPPQPVPAPSPMAQRTVEARPGAALAALPADLSAAAVPGPRSKVRP